MSAQHSEVFRVGELSLHPKERSLKRQGISLPISPKAFDALLLLAENSGALVERSELRKRLWGDAYVEEATLARVISDLRKALGESGGERRYVETVPKFGYRLVAPVSRDLPGEAIPIKLQSTGPYKLAGVRVVLCLAATLLLLAAAASGVYESSSGAYSNVSGKAQLNYDLGRYYWNRRNPLALDKFQKAIEEDPQFGAAYTGLADSILLASPQRPDRWRIQQARKMLERATQIDPLRGEPHATLGLLAESTDLNWSVAEREFRAAIRLSPRYATAHHWYAEFLSMTGHFELAEAEFREAQKLDPFSPIIETDLAQLYTFEHDYRRSLQTLDAALELDPEFSLARERKGYAFMFMRLPDEAPFSLRLKAIKSRQR